MDETRRCSTCCFLKASELWVNLGQCRRSSPSHFTGAVTPVTRDSDWCGEHMFKTEFERMRAQAAKIPSWSATGGGSDE